MLTKKNDQTAFVEVLFAHGYALSECDEVLSSAKEEVPTDILTNNVVIINKRILERLVDIAEKYLLIQKQEAAKQATFNPAGAIAERVLSDKHMIGAMEALIRMCVFNLQIAEDKFLDKGYMLTSRTDPTCYLNSIIGRWHSDELRNNFLTFLKDRKSLINEL